jgi:NADH:ubiquinone oxidoreductase subunit 6 (subunit J)
MTKLDLKLFVLFNIMGIIAIVVLGSIEIATKHSVYGLLWFIPICLIVASIGILIGYRQTKAKKAKD